ncbi:hypothetical protein K504DRAFT_225704 [Pleomassaria siparia CBS 279.74]|uniref:Uncharacterized protein n=1 Tax=Pleomassaria siparia CBS 279.74 TaxID=1314801 RepID=A0A6G1KFL1_9PLEO|nr:hypothetical protein K504DRAFT_225704 [Pleomassaria siparia CBS 279.74]
MPACQRVGLRPYCPTTSLLLSRSSPSLFLFLSLSASLSLSLSLYFALALTLPLPLPLPTTNLLSCSLARPPPTSLLSAIAVLVPRLQPPSPHVFRSMVVCSI